MLVNKSIINIFIITEKNTLIYLVSLFLVVFFGGGVVPHNLSKSISEANANSGRR